MVGHPFLPAQCRESEWQWRNWSESDEMAKAMSRAPLPPRPEERLIGTGVLTIDVSRFAVIGPLKRTMNAVPSATRGLRHRSTN